MAKSKNTLSLLQAAMVQAKRVSCCLKARPQQDVARPASAYRNISFERLWLSEQDRTMKLERTEGQPPSEGLTPRPPAACRTREKVTAGLGLAGYLPRSVLASCIKPAPLTAGYRE